MEGVFLSKADITELEEQYVLDALRSGWVAPLGPHVDRFETEIAERVGVRSALALSSGTAALHLALLELGAGPGRIVVLPSMTFAASANAVLYTGATPVFVDSYLQDGNIDPQLLIDAIETLRREGADVCAAMTVDLFGRTVDYDQIEPALASLGVPLIEDAAESLGATHAGREAGSFGRVAALSFNGNKVMTTSGGGMLLSNDDDLVAHARKLSAQAREPAPWYEHTETGYNYRMSNILAALGRGQLTRLDAMVERRRRIRQRYVDALRDVDGLSFLGAIDSLRDARSNSWLTCITVNPDVLGVAPDGVIKSLAAANIEARHLWKPMHMQPVFTGARFFDNGAARRLFQHGVTLPSGSALSDTDIDRVITALDDTLRTAS